MDDAAWEIPNETSVLLKQLDNTCQGVLLKIGNLEATYQAEKGALLEELRVRRQQFKTLLDDAAKKGGLDIEKQRWVMDFAKMALNKAA